MPKKKKQEAPVEVVRTLHYFGEDGNYGNADGLTVMETTHWDTIDWDIIEGTADWYRPLVARLITESYEPGADENILRAEFAKYGVDISDYEKQ
jgi:hypothetical protein